MIKASVGIRKSFDEGKFFQKTWESKDFQTFFAEEGEYLDRLSQVTQDKGEKGEWFEIVYAVRVEKEA